MDEGTAAELERKVQGILRSPRVLLEVFLFQSMDEDHKKEHFQKGEEINPVWFDEKPPEPSMFGEIDPRDWWFNSPFNIYTLLLAKNACEPVSSSPIL